MVLPLEKPYEDIFQGEDRIYYDLVADVEEDEQKITAYLAEKGYKITDYKNGYATDAAGKQQFRIGKLLKGDAELQNSFKGDKTRLAGGERAEDNQMVVISRHPYDVARMTTSRKWSSSCMNEGGMFHQYVEKDINEGTLVAYLVNESDPNINDPLARRLLKPFNGTKTDETILIPGKTYGNSNEKFTETTWAIVKEEFNIGKEGVFKLNDNLYEDGLSSYYTVDDEGNYIEYDRLPTYLPSSLRDGTSTAKELLEECNIEYEEQDDGKFIIRSSLNLSNCAIKALPVDFSNIVFEDCDLDLSDNQISSLGEFTFSGRNLDVSCNQISSLEDFVFEGRNLDIRRNHIDSMNGFIFSGRGLDISDNQLGNLKGFTFSGNNLNLDSNKISDLKGFSFKGNNCILSQNQISSLDGITLNGNCLDLSYNQITSLKGFSFDGGFIDLDGNQINTVEGSCISAEVIDCLENPLSCEEIQEGIRAEYDKAMCAKKESELESDSPFVDFEDDGFER